MKTYKAAPGAKRLIESLRNMGYECSTAIADLVDNSLAAGASEVHVEIFARDGARPANIVIADNGRGMDRDQLYEAMRFGAFQEYSAEDLGKYGLGLKTASLSQCRNLTVSSRRKPAKGTRPRRSFMRWDLDYVYGTDDWDLLAPAPEELTEWEMQALTHAVSEAYGTVVLWQGLDEALPLLSAPDVRQKERFLASLIRDVSDHLRMVFHRFMEGAVTGRRRLTLYVCGQKLEPWDPFCRREDTRELEPLSLSARSRDVDGQEVEDNVIIAPFILPREDEFSDARRWKDAAGPQGWNAQQGFYFYRNNRLLQAGGWSWLRAPDEHTKLLRVGVHFSRALDRAFDINVTKMRARIPDEIKETVKSHLSRWTREARERYDLSPSKRSGAQKTSPAHAPSASPRRQDAPATVNVGTITFARSNAPTHRLSIVDGTKPGQLKVLVPQGHEFAALFDLNGEDDLKKLCLTALSILEAVHDRRLSPDRIPLDSLRRALRKHL